MSRTSIPVSLASLEALHSNAGNDLAAAQARIRARRLAATQRVPVPEWAQSRRESARPEPRDQARSVPVSSVLPWQLSEWRRANAGSIVHLGQRGISLITLQYGTVTYASISDAIEAVTPRKQHNHGTTAQ